MFIKRREKKILINKLNEERNVNTITIPTNFSFNNKPKPNIFRYSKSMSHSDQTGKLTPLVVSLSSEDKSQKVKGVDLICIVEFSGSMSYPSSKIELVKESLKYLVNLMNEEDNLAIVKFESTSRIVN